ncbi:hypothetical protein G9P44_006041 [Scheffersomyces stipitis]|nr:hypothetical protein G9P44_006041 [Scheffersomyces stipitis]
MSSTTILGLNEITDHYIKATTGVVIGVYITVLFPLLFIAYFYYVFEKTGVNSTISSLFNGCASSYLGKLVLLQLVPLLFSVLFAYWATKY